MHGRPHWQVHTKIRGFKPQHGNNENQRRWEMNKQDTASPLFPGIFLLYCLFLKFTVCHCNPAHVLLGNTGAALLQSSLLGGGDRLHDTHLATKSSSSGPLDTPPMAPFDFSSSAPTTTSGGNATPPSPRAKSFLLFLQDTHQYQLSPQCFFGLFFFFQISHHRE